MIDPGYDDGRWHCHQVLEIPSLTYSSDGPLETPTCRARSRFVASFCITRTQVEMAHKDRPGRLPDHRRPYPKEDLVRCAVPPRLALMR